MKFVLPSETVLRIDQTQITKFTDVTHIKRQDIGAKTLNVDVYRRRCLCFDGNDVIR